MSVSLSELLSGLILATIRLLLKTHNVGLTQMREGSDTFLVHAYLPVEASFGLADEIRRRFEFQSRGGVLDVEGRNCCR